MLSWMAEVPTVYLFLASGQCVNFFQELVLKSELIKVFYAIHDKLEDEGLATSLSIAGKVILLFSSMFLT
jgi:hypothetical protein